MVLLLLFVGDKRAVGESCRDGGCVMPGVGSWDRLAFDEHCSMGVA
jgi:hypothetical protein